MFGLFKKKESKKTKKLSVKEVADDDDDRKLSPIPPVNLEKLRPKTKNLLKNNAKHAKTKFGIDLTDSSDDSGGQTIVDMFPNITEDGTVSTHHFTSGSEGSSRSNSEDKYLDELQKQYPTGKIRFTRDDKGNIKQYAMESMGKTGVINFDAENKLKNWSRKGSPRNSPSPTGLEPHEIGQPSNVEATHPVLAMFERNARRRKEQQKQKTVENPDYEVGDGGHNPFKHSGLGGTMGGRKTRKKCRRFRNNYKKNKMSRNYIMLKQCGGGKAKMGSKSKPYSSKRKAMRSRRRVCYYKKKGRTLKMKKKAKKSRKKSRRRRRR